MPDKEWKSHVYCWLDSGNLLASIYKMACNYIVGSTLCNIHVLWIRLVDIIFKSHPIFPTSTVLQKRNLHMVAFCAPPLHNSLYHPFMRPFTSRHCHDHMAIWSRALCFKLGYNLRGRGYLASLLTILRAHHKPSRGVSKITTERLRQFPEVSSIICHSFGIAYWSSFCLFYSHLT